MSKLTSQQKEFLKGIPNKKARQEQKIQFKLQNSYNGNVVFINGKFETDLEELAHFMNGHPMMDIMFKEEFEEINGKGKTWYETSAKEVEEKWNEKVINGILSSEPTLTKEVLNDLTNPIQVKNRIEIYTLEELSQFKDLTLKEVNDCLYILYQMQTNDASNLLLKIFMNIKDKIINTEKQDIIDKSNNNDIPMEFCVEITKENQEILEKVSGFPNLDRGFYLRSNSDGNSFEKVHTNLRKSISDYEFYREVSTEEFLRYIGKEDLIPKKNNHKFIDYGEFKNEIPDFKHNFNQKPLEFDLPKKVDFSSNYIDSTSKFHELILKQIQEGSDPISTINDYLINVQKFYYYKTNNKIAEITEIFPKLENKTFPNSNNENVIKIKFDASKLTNNETKSENLDFELEKSIVNLVNNITALKMQVGNFNHKGYSIVFVRDDSKIWDIQYPIRKKV